MLFILAGQDPDRKHEDLETRLGRSNETMRLVGNLGLLDMVAISDFLFLRCHILSYHLLASGERKDCWWWFGIDICMSLF
jgi:hypothetical protein